MDPAKDHRIPVTPQTNVILRAFNSLLDDMCEVQVECLILVGTLTREQASQLAQAALQAKADVLRAARAKPRTAQPDQIAEDTIPNA